MFTTQSYNFSLEVLTIAEKHPPGLILGWTVSGLLLFSHVLGTVTDRLEGLSE